MARILGKRFVWTALALPVALGGCGAPVAFQVASLAADGISYLATGKSIFDHGLSAAAEKDCAMLRAVTEGEVCRDEAPDLAAAAPAPVPEGEEAPAPAAQPVFSASTVAFAAISA
ncbi:MAG: hypothetical protein H7841_06195, partial [Magnetospirillum sp. WYHS-4]